MKGQQGREVRESLEKLSLKTCSRCRNKFPPTIEFFHRASRNRDGLRTECKKCHLKNQYIYFESHREAMRLKCKSYHHKNREKIICEKREKYRLNSFEILASQRRAYSKNPDKFKERSKKYKKSNTEKVKGNDKRWRLLNLDRARKNNKNWKIRNPDKVRQRGRIDASRRRARVRDADGCHSWADIQKQYKTQRALCWWRGKALDDKFHVDHRIPISRGGSNGPENLVCSCESCNCQKYNRLPHEWNGRLI